MSQETNAVVFGDKVLKHTTSYTNPSPSKPRNIEVIQPSVNHLFKPKVDPEQREQHETLERIVERLPPDEQAQYPYSWYERPLQCKCTLPRYGPRTFSDHECYNCKLTIPVTHWTGPVYQKWRRFMDNHKPTPKWDSKKEEWDSTPDDPFPVPPIVIHKQKPKSKSARKRKNKPRTPQTETSSRQTDTNLNEDLGKFMKGERPESFIRWAPGYLLPRWRPQSEIEEQEKLDEEGDEGVPELVEGALVHEAVGRVKDITSEQWGTFSDPISPIPLRHRRGKTKQVAALAASIQHLMPETKVEVHGRCPEVVAEVQAEIKKQQKILEEAGDFSYTAQNITRLEVRGQPYIPPGTKLYADWPDVRPRHNFS